MNQPKNERPLLAAIAPSRKDSPNHRRIGIIMSVLQLHDVGYRVPIQRNSQSIGCAVSTGGQQGCWPMVNAIQEESGVRSCRVLHAM